MTNLANDLHSLVQIYWIRINRLILAKESRNIQPLIKIVSDCVGRDILKTFS